MDDTAQGFRIGAAFFAWGTLFDVVAPGVIDAGYASTELPCASAYGFATVYAAITAPQPDRPVLNVAYELAGTDMRPKDVLAQLVILLGAPLEIERDELSPHANSPDHVVLHATWKTREGRSVGLSLYGSPRPSNFGDGIGKLYLGWDDLEQAAAPWVPAWRAANEELARVAQTPGTIKTFDVLHDVKTSDRSDPARVASLCLTSPELLDTPAPIAGGLGTRGFALWSDSAGTRWHLSTADVTVVLGGPDTSTVKVANIAPARGGGSSTIDVGAWWVRCEWNSRAIEDAVRALERIPDLTVARYSGHDA